MRGPKNVFRPISIWAVLWVVASSPAAHARRQDGPTPPVVQPGVNQSVVVDVIPTDRRGRIVESLKAADFEIREQGTIQSIEDVRFVKRQQADGGPVVAIGSEADERAEGSRSNARLFALFLDEFHVSGSNSARVRAAVTSFVNDNLGPSDLLVVMRPLDSILAIRLTRDRDRIRQGIEAFEGRRGDYTPRGAYEQNYIAGTPARMEQLRAQVAISALNALANHLGSLNKESRKTLVVVSEGLPRVDRRRGLESLPTIDSVIRSANRANVSIYAVDPREAPANGAATVEEDDALPALTAATDGQRIGNATDLSSVMRRIAADASAYYLLVFRSEHAQDGRPHDLAVAVKRPGITVRARKEYWAERPNEELRASLLRPRPPATPEPPRRISPLIRPWFGASRGADGKTRVLFVWEPAARVPGDRAKQVYASRVVLKVLAADGGPLFEGSVLPTGPLRPDPLDEEQARAIFEAPPGPLRLRMSIEDQASQVLDSDVREISVRDMSAPVVLGTPQVLRARTARDFRALENDSDAVPVAAREFSRTERLLIRFPAYSPEDSSLVVSARLLNRTGQAIRELMAKTKDESPRIYQVDLPLASMAGGEYLIEFAAKSAAGQVKDLLEFRIKN
jgi:VWFA-related protein